MKAILVLALIAVAIFAVVCIVYFFLPAKNPIWIKKQLKNLEVGEVRWIKSTPKKGRQGIPIRISLQRQKESRTSQNFSVNNH